MKIWNSMMQSYSGRTKKLMQTIKEQIQNITQIKDVLFLLKALMDFDKNI